MKPLTHTFARVFRATFPLVLVIGLTACDSSEPEDPDPEPSQANITVTLNAVTANDDCDVAAGNPGDFQFRIEVVDVGNSPIDMLDLPLGSTYGTRSNSADVIPMFEGDVLDLNQLFDFQQPRESGSGFFVTFSATEWDSMTEADSDLDDLSESRQHAFANGQFEDIVGEKSIDVGDECEVTLEYSVSVQ